MLMAAWREPDGGVDPIDDIVKGMRAEKESALAAHRAYQRRFKP